MELDSADLGARGKAFRAVDLEIGLTVAEDCHQLQKIGCPGHCVPLEELLSANSVRRSDDRARSPFNMVDQPWTDSLVIAGQVLFRDGNAVVGVWPKRLVGIRDQHAHDVYPSAAAQRLSRRRPGRLWDVG